MELQIVFLCIVSLCNIAMKLGVFPKFFVFLKFLQGKDFVLQIHIATCPLPDTTYRVDSCPEANNITAWKKASLRLNCSEYSETYSEEVIKGKKLYHCLASNFLNETIEFCGPNTAIEKGLYVFISFILSFFHPFTHANYITRTQLCVFIIFCLCKNMYINLNDSSDPPNA